MAENAIIPDKQGTVEPFDYSLVSADEAEKLREYEKEIKQETAGYFTKLGEKFKEAQGILADHNGGVFEKWYTSLGFKKRTVYRLIQRYDFVLFHSGTTSLETIEELPLTLSYSISAPDAPKELVDRVLSGDITTNAEYKKLKAELETAKESLEEHKQHISNLAKQRGQFYDKCIALEKRVKELEERPVEVAVQTVERDMDNYIEIGEHQKVIDQFNEERDELERENLQLTREAHAIKTELEARIKELEANGGSNPDELFKAYRTAAEYPLNALMKFARGNQDYLEETKKFIMGIVDNTEVQNEAL